MANAVILVYDITKKESFEHIEQWLKNVDTKCKKNILKILIGNKYDLKQERKVTEHEAKVFAQKNDLPYFETSAKDNYNVTELFERTVEDFLCSNGLLNNLISNTIEIGSTPEEKMCNCGC